MRVYLDDTPFKTSKLLYDDNNLQLNKKTPQNKEIIICG